MIPIINEPLEQEEEMPSLNYKMDFVSRVVGKVDNAEAMKQVCYKILLTERYEYLIYSWDYGIELADLFGQSMEYVVPELERRITDALKQDSRVDSVTNFTYDIKRHSVECAFTVNTIFGAIDLEKTVNV